MPSSDFETVFLYKDEGPIENQISVGDYRIGYFLLRSPHKTSENEDVVFVDKKNGTLIFGVADGAGGHPKGQEAAFIVGDEILNGKYSLTEDQFNPFHLIEVINNRVRALKVGARSTLAFATIINDNIRCFAVGDSEIVYWNGNGAEVYSNVPHSNTGYRVEAGILDQDESLDDPERHVVTNLVGDEAIRIESTSAFEVKKGHTILIGTDGLFDNVSHAELRELVAKGVFEKSFEMLTEICKKQEEDKWKKTDDIGFVLIRKIKS